MTGGRFGGEGTRSSQRSKAGGLRNPHVGTPGRVIPELWGSLFRVCFLILFRTAFRRHFGYFLVPKWSPKSFKISPNMHHNFGMAFLLFFLALDPQNVGFQRVRTLIVCPEPCFLSRTPCHLFSTKNSPSSLRPRF